MTRYSVLTGALLLAACATPPPGGPSLLVLPGTAKSFDQFRHDDNDCRGYAHYQVGGRTTEQAATDSAVKSAVVGTAIGTAAGAALGGGEGAAVGAGLGLAGGALAGSGASHAAVGSLQRRYDHAFIQCMYAKGHKVPVVGRYQDSGPATHAARTPPDYRPK